MSVTTKTIEQRIRDGLFKNYKPNSYESNDFVNAIYELFDKFAARYTQEWERLEDNERVYHGDSWSQSPYASQKLEDDENAPKPHTPTIHSSIETVKADMAEDEPEIIIHPDAYGSKISARVLTHVANQELASCRFGTQWRMLTHDVLVGGWTVYESGYDPDMNAGNGGAFIRYVVNTNFMCDPETVDIQDGRACFKFVRRPRDWYAQRFPDVYEDMRDDAPIPSTDTYSSTVTPTASDDRMRLIEAWFRVYDPKTNKHQVHFVQVAGHQVLYNSATEFKSGYYDHGQYPFIVTPLFPEKGSALGFGLVDLFKDQQRYSDKLDQFILKNAFLAASDRIINTDASGIKDEDLADWSKEILHGDQIGDAYVDWFNTKPLPGYLFDYVELMRQNIKNDSGANDQARGQTGGGVTAASAINALQQMATKRSRMTSLVMHEGFCEAARQMLAVLRQHHVMTREVPVTIDGRELLFEYDRNKIKPKSIDGVEPDKNQYESLVRIAGAGFLKKGKELPIEYFVDVKTARQTQYQKMAHNELWLQMMQTVQNADPVIMLEGLEFEEKEQLLDNIRRAQQGGMVALRQQIAQLQEIVKQQSEQVAAAEEAQQAATAIIQQNQQQQPKINPAQMAQKMA